MKHDIQWLRQFVLSIVKPLRSGKTFDKESDNINQGMDSVYPDGYVNKFRMTSPFGLVSNVPKGITGFFQSLFGSGHENILLGLLHHDRPVVNNVGEVVLYSTNESGQQVETKITLTNDGRLVINCSSEMTIECTVATVTAPEVNVNSETATVTATTSAAIVSPLVEIGDGALEKILNGETFQTFFNQHTHIGNLGYPTSVPNSPSIPAHLSNKVKAGK